MPAIVDSRPKKADRHKSRRTVALSDEMYEAIQQLANRNKRPVLWEVRLALEEHLRKAGLWPDEEEEG